jgi:hypothetical protein
MAAWGDIAYGLCQSGAPNVLRGTVKIEIGAGGAINSCVGATGVSCAVTGSGAYTLTFPTAPDVHITYSILKQSEAVADHIDVHGVDITPTGGTATFRTVVGSTGAAVDPASGDQLVADFSVYLNGRGL